VNNCSIAGADNFEKGVGVWCAALEFNSDCCEEKDLDGGTCVRKMLVLISFPSVLGIQTGCVEERTRNTVFICHCRGLEKSRGPCPTTDYGSSNKS
jgi:hypothetical protein